MSRLSILVAVLIVSSAQQQFELAPGDLFGLWTETNFFSGCGLFVTSQKAVQLSNNGTVLQEQNTLSLVRFGTHPQVVALLSPASSSAFLVIGTESWLSVSESKGCGMPFSSRQDLSVSLPSVTQWQRAFQPDPYSARFLALNLYIEVDATPNGPQASPPITLEAPNFPGASVVNKGVGKGLTFPGETQLSLAFASQITSPKGTIGTLELVDLTQQVSTPSLRYLPNVGAFQSYPTASRWNGALILLNPLNGSSTCDALGFFAGQDQPDSIQVPCQLEFLPDGFKANFPESSSSCYQFIVPIVSGSTVDDSVPIVVNFIQIFAGSTANGQIENVFSLLGGSLTLPTGLLLPSTPVVMIDTFGGLAMSGKPGTISLGLQSTKGAVLYVDAIPSFTGVVQCPSKSDHSSVSWSQKDVVFDQLCLDDCKMFDPTDCSNQTYSCCQLRIQPPPASPKTQCCSICSLGVCQAGECKVSNKKTFF